MKMRSLRSQRYRNRMLTAGDEFEASRADGKVLMALKRAEEAKVQPSEPEPEAVETVEPEIEADQAGPTATEIRRMRKAELAEFLRDQGQDVDEADETREELLDRALALAE